MRFCLLKRLMQDLAMGLEPREAPSSLVTDRLICSPDVPSCAIRPWIEGCGCCDVTVEEAAPSIVGSVADEDDDDQWSNRVEVAVMLAS